MPANVVATTNAEDADGVAAGGTLDVAVPAGGATGDKYVLVSMAGTAGSTATLPTCPGFAQVGGGIVDDTAFFGHTIYLLERDHDGTEGANFTVTQPTDATDRWGLVCLLLTDVGDQDSDMPAAATVGSGASIDFPAETTTEADCLVIGVVSSGQFGAITTPAPSNFAAVSGSPFVSDWFGVYTYLQATAGSTPTDTITFTGGTSSAASVLAYRSAAAGPPVGAGVGAVVTAHAGQGAGSVPGGGGDPTYVDGFSTFLASHDPHTAVKLNSTDQGAQFGNDPDGNWAGYGGAIYSSATGFPNDALNQQQDPPQNIDWDIYTVTDCCFLLYVPSGLASGTTYGLMHNGGNTNAQSGWLRNNGGTYQLAMNHNTGNTNQDDLVYDLPATDRWYAVGFQYEDGAGGMAIWVDGVEVETATRSFALAYGSGNPDLGNSGGDEPTGWSGNTAIDGTGILIGQLVIGNPNKTNSSPAGHGDAFHQDYAAAHIDAGVTPAAGVGAVVTAHAGQGSGSATPVGAGVGAIVTAHAGQAAGSSTPVGAGTPAIVTAHAGQGSGSSTAIGAGVGAVVEGFAGQAAGSATAVGTGTPAVVVAVAGVGTASAAAQASGIGAIVTAHAGQGSGSSTAVGAGTPAIVESFAGVGSASSAAQATGVGAVVVAVAGEGAGTSSPVGAGTGAVVVAVAGQGAGSAAGQAQGVGAVVVAVAGQGSGSAVAVGAGVGAVVVGVAGEGVGSTAAVASGVGAVVTAHAGEGSGTAVGVGVGQGAVVVAVAGQGAGASGAVAAGVPAVVLAVAGSGDGSAVPVGSGIGAVVAAIAGQGGGSASAIGAGRPAYVESVAGVGSGIGAVLILQVAAAAISRRTSATVGARTSASGSRRTSAAGRRGP